MTDSESHKEFRAWQHFERIGLAAGGASLLIVGALLSGLTQASCYLIAKTYGHAIGGFGFSGIIAVIGIMMSFAGNTAQRLSSLLVAFSVVSFIAAGIAGIENLRRSANTCFFVANKDDHSKTILIENPFEAFWADQVSWR